MFFDGFRLERVGGLRVRHGGAGPAVLLLHGHPRTHTTWWRVAPLLVSAGFTVVCPDLPGYGESNRTPSQSKRELAGELAAWRAGEALRVMTEDEGLSVREVVQWCGDEITSDYPNLSKQDVEFAKRFVAAYPRVGRPRAREAPAR